MNFTASLSSNMLKVVGPFRLVQIRDSVQMRATSALPEPSASTLKDLELLSYTNVSQVSDYQLSPLSFGGVSGHDLAWESTNPAIATVDSNGFVTWVGDGRVTITARTGGYSKNKVLGLYTRQAYTTTSFTGYVSGSLARHAKDAVDGRLAGKTVSAVRIFTSQNHTAPSYVRNTDGWPYDIDLTPISPWNSSGGPRFAGTLISPRHILFAAHYQIPVGATVRFVRLDNTVVDIVMTAKLTHPLYTPYYPDLTVGVLASDVPAGISFAKVLPAAWASYLPSLSNAYSLPALCLDQEEKALVTDFTSVYGGKVGFTRPTDSQRLLFYEDKIGGDSGNPAFLILNNTLVLVTVWTYGGAGSGTFVTYHKDAINTMMTQLGGGYQLTEIALGAFPSYA